MSQYTISLQAIIDIYGNVDVVDYNLTEKRIKAGRPLLFDFIYSTNEKFNELFETGFIIDYLNEDIYTQYVDLFKEKLKNDVLLKIPMYLNQYEAINSLLISELNKISESENETINKSKTSGKSSTKNNAENQTIGSQFPYYIENANNFNSIKYADSGSRAKSNGSGESSSNSDTEAETKNKTKTTGNSLDNIDKYLNAQRNIIQSAIDSFSDLFMKVW